jgi:3-dehydroquinate synthase
MRGIKYYYVPTTLLAMVDASIGGKTAVDLTVGKNLIGTFYPPQAIIIDPVLLQTLPSLQFSQGMAEVIKHGLINKALFNWLEKNIQTIQQRDVPTLQQLLVKNVKVKKMIVESDPEEHQLRMQLNLGHTFGHAIEQLSNYTVSHGEAVAIGLVYAAQYAQLPQINRLEKLLLHFNLPIALEQPFSPQAMVTVMATDKKNQEEYITLVLPKQIGDIEMNTHITKAQLLRFLRHYHQA